MKFAEKNSVRRLLGTLVVASPALVLIAIFANVLSLVILLLTVLVSLGYTTLFGSSRLRSVYSLSAIFLPHLIFWFLSFYFLKPSTGIVEVISSSAKMSGIALYIVWPLIVGTTCAQMLVEYYAERKKWW